LKEETLDILEDAKTGDEYIDKKINIVIWLVSQSLCDKLWINDTHIDPKYGGCVFFLELIAIRIMLCYPNVEAFGIVIDQLLQADYLLASVALKEAESMEVKNPENQDIYDYCICKSNLFMDRAINKIQDGKYTCAVCNFMMAWKYAQYAMNWANKEDSCSCCHRNLLCEIALL
jgi:hypothetical protein